MATTWIWQHTWNIGKFNREAVLKAIDDLASTPGAYQEQGLRQNMFVIDEQSGEVGHVMIWDVKPERHMFNQASLKISNERWANFLKSQGLTDVPTRIVCFEVIEPNVKPE